GERLDGATAAPARGDEGVFSAGVGIDQVQIALIRPRIGGLAVEAAWPILFFVIVEVFAFAHREADALVDRLPPDKFDPAGLDIAHLEFDVARQPLAVAAADEVKAFAKADALADDGALRSLGGDGEVVGWSCRQFV